MVSKLKKFVLPLELHQLLTPIISYPFFIISLHMGIDLEGLNQGRHEE